MSFFCYTYCMVEIQTFATLIFIVQLFHSVEELSTGFYKKWFFFKMSFRTFLTFEILLYLLVLLILIFNFPYKNYLLAFFIVLMFAQSLWHLAWWAMEKKYVPGLVTAIIHVVIFLIFYFQYVRI